MPDRVPAADVPVRPAATVMLLRDGEAGLEVFMLQRTLSASFARGSYVFPGGRVDDADDDIDQFEAICADLDDETASQRLAIERGGLAWYVAAIRECFEEAGVLLARRDDGGDTIVRFAEPDVVERFNAARDRVHDGSLSLVDLCRDEGLLLLPGVMQFVAHWITPVGERRRFDTRFFVAPAPDAQTPLHDDHETIASLWVRPHDALTMHAAGELLMLPPTVTCLRMLDASATVAEAMNAAAAIDFPTPIQPKLLFGPDGKMHGVTLPGDDGYDAASDPEFIVSNPR